MGLFSAIGGVVGSLFGGPAGGAIGSGGGGFLDNLFSGGGSSNGGGRSGLADVLLGGIGGMAKSKEAEKMLKKKYEYELKAQKELADQQRQFALQDRAYRQGGIGNFKAYYNPNFAAPAYNAQNPFPNFQAALSPTSSAVVPPAVGGNINQKLPTLNK